ncbi:hypothetical protein BCR39DRAFT_254585 [Naematelia encephala]|uniref:Uncharacterized protein n=1 Tax=Naematelia encephala TaxID=71784 RepID=A0A1Y2AWD7_9TREE|nr:hypothetical protein BCR39DRAFT_254585 [Naematelia encephala]
MVAVHIPTPSLVLYHLPAEAHSCSGPGRTVPVTKRTNESYSSYPNPDRPFPAKSIPTQVSPSLHKVRPAPSPPRRKAEAEDTSGHGGFRNLE